MAPCTALVTEVARSRRQADRHVAHEARASATAVLVALRERGQLTTARVRLVAAELGVRGAHGLAVADRGSCGIRAIPACSVEVTEDDLVELTYRHGNIAAVHRARGGSPGIMTLRRAFDRALSPGQMAGVQGGERRRREFDTYLARGHLHRNDCQEADRCELAIEVRLADRQLVKPWLTSFLDRSSRALCGWAISGYPSQESVLAALRSALLTEPLFGPVGGLPLALR